MPYDNPITEDYVQVSSAFGAATESSRHQGPKGKTGKVRDIWIDITADMVGTTTVPEICVGTAAAAFEYARFRLGTAIGTGYTTAQGPRRASIVAGDQFDNALYEDFVGHVKMGTLLIPKDATFFISRVLGVGGTPAGTGRSIVWIDWF